MSGDFLFELIEKAHWSYQIRSSINESIDQKSRWSFKSILNRWFNRSVNISSNAEYYLNENIEKPFPFAIHLLSSRLAVIVNNRLCIYSLLTSDELLSIVFDENPSDRLNSLICLSWSDNGKLISLGHWSGLVSVYSSIDGQLIHRLTSKSSFNIEDSFVQIWFSGSDASQFVDLLCLKRRGELIRYVMSRDDIASCAEEKFPFEIYSSIVETNRNYLYVLPFEQRSIFIYKILDTNPSIELIKDFQFDEISSSSSSDEVIFIRFALSPSELSFVVLGSNRTIFLFENHHQIRLLTQFKLNEDRPNLSDLNFWDDRTLILFYRDGSISFHDGKESLEEFRYERNQFDGSIRLSHQRTEKLYLVDSKRISSGDSTETEEKSSFFRHFAEKFDEKLAKFMEMLPLDPDRLIENLIDREDFGEALRVAKMFQRENYSDEIHEKQLRQCSTQLKSHLTKIRSRLRVFQLVTTFIYPTFDEQILLVDFALEKSMKKSFFLRLSHSDELFFKSISEENQIESKEKVDNEEILPLSSTSSLTIPQKQLLIYRRKLLDQRRKLNLFDQIFDRFHSDLFEKFRSWNFVEIARRAAREGNFDALKMIFDVSIPEIRGKNLLKILDEIPDGIPVENYSNLIPSIDEIGRKRIERKENDWTDEFIEENDDENHFHREDLFRWFDTKIRRMEKFGFVLNAFDLVRFAIENDNFVEFHSTKKSLHFEFLFDSFSQENFSLEQIEQFDDEEIFRRIFNCSTESFEKRFDEIFVPTVEYFLSSISTLFEEFFIEQIQRNVDIYPLMKLVKSKNLFEKKQIDRFIRSTIFNLNSIEQISIGEKILNLNEEKSDLDQLVSSAQIFIKWNVKLFPKDIRKIFESEESMSNAISHLIQSAIKQKIGQKNLSFGTELYQDLESIVSYRLSAQTLSNLFISNLLQSGSIESFQIVRSMLTRSHYPIILQSAIDYIDSASNSSDPSMILAKNCLDLIDDQNLVVPQRNLIECQTICDFFHYPITPIEIRRHRKPIQIISSILQSNPQSYLNPSKLISLSLDLPTTDRSNQKNRCVLIIAEHCLKIKDLSMCWEYCSHLIEENYSPSWKCLTKLIEENPSLINSRILTFLICHSDENLLDKILQQSIRFRDKNIFKIDERSISTYSFYSNFFYDRFYSQQLDFRELPSMKSPPIDEREALKYVNIDTSLFIAAYLASNTKLEPMICRDNEYSLQLSIYCQSLMKSVRPCRLNSIPSSIIDVQDEKDPLQKELYERLKLTREYSLLTQLDKTIDLKRFEFDEEYRRSTIFGLFMFDDPKFDLAEQLAMKYQISIDQCHHVYFEYLLTNSSLKIVEIRKRLKPFLNSERLKKNRQIKLDLVKRLHSNVWPLIDGKNHEKLKLFYEIKKSLGDGQHAQKHIETLKMFADIFPFEFDYKFFLNSPEKFIEVYSNDENIYRLAQCVDQLKISSSTILTSNSIWIFFIKTNSSRNEIFHFVDQIDSEEDFRSIVDFLISNCSIRQRIRHLEKVVQQKNYPIEENLCRRFENLKFFDKFLDEQNENDFNQLDLSTTNEEKERLIAKIYLYQQNIEILYFLSQRIFPQISMKNLLQILVEEFHQEIESTKDEKSLKLKNLLENLTFDRFDRNVLFDSFQNLSRLETLDRRIRFQLIEQINRMFDKENLHSDDLLLFEQFRLSTLFAPFASFQQLNEDEIETNEKREILFDRFLSEAERPIHFECLIEILQDVWAKHQFDRSETNLTMKIRLIDKIIEKNSNWIKFFDENLLQLDDREFDVLIDYFCQNDEKHRSALKLSLIFRRSSLNPTIFSSIRPEWIDDEFLSMSIQRKRVLDLLETNSSLIEFYLKGKFSPEDQIELLNQLKTNEDFLLESSSIFIEKENYSSFKTFSLIIDTFDKFFSTLK